MTRISSIAVVLSIFCPTLCMAGDAQLTPMQRLVALTTSTNAEKRITPRPKLQFACGDAGSACGPGYDGCCKGGCYIPPGNTHGECR
jgi:hypothetical protein